MAAAARSQGLSPGFKFEPSDQMLVELFLLPYLRDGELPVPGLVFVEDDHLRGLPLPPWMLLDRHGRGDEDEAYFIGPTGAGEGSRQVRSVTGGGKWVKQRSEGNGEVVVAPGGETFRWEKFSLNFHRDDRRSGSTGWVMHEYIVFPPAGSAVAASHRATHITFTGHGQNRKRVPDGYVVVLDDDDAAAAPPPESEQSNQEQEYAAYTDQIQQQCFVPEQQQSSQHYFPPPAEQSNYQQFLPALEQTQSNQEYAYGEQSQCYIMPEQQLSNQEAEYAFACYEQQQQQHYFHGDLTSWQEPLETSSSSSSQQQFLGQEQLLPDGLLDGFGEISPEDDAFLDEVEMQNIIAGLFANQSP